MKKIITVLLVMAITATAAIGGTMAYLTSQDSQVNVMTMGSVKIQQIEQERDASGALQNFTQAKPAYPVVGQIDWDETGVDVNGTAYKVFDDGLKNVVDKIVTVKNIGLSDAYVRTIIALEAPEGDPNNLIHVNVNGDPVLTKTNWAPVTVNNVEYVYSVFTYVAPLAPGKTSAPSLVQVFLDSAATNEDVAKFGNTWEILALSQAAQTAGFDNAPAALDTAFGAATEDNVAQWLSQLQAPALATSADELRDAMKVEGANIVLTEDIIVTKDDVTGWGQHMFLANGKNITVDLNGHNITIAEDASQVGSVFTAANGGSITIVGDGNVVVKNGKAFMGWTIASGSHIYVYGGNYSGNAHESKFALFYVQEGKIDVYGGKFTYPVAANDNWGFNVHNDVGDNLVIQIHEGALLQHEAFQYGDDTRIQLAAGCTLQQVTVDGQAWYQVVRSE